MIFLGPPTDVLLQVGAEVQDADVQDVQDSDGDLDNANDNVNDMEEASDPEEVIDMDEDRVPAEPVEEEAADDVAETNEQQPGFYRGQDFQNVFPPEFAHLIFFSCGSSFNFWGGIFFLEQKLAPTLQ